MDELAALRLQIEWGADEALQDAPWDRFAAVPAVPAIASSPVRVALAAAGTGGPARMASDGAAAGVAAGAGDLVALHAAMDGFACPLRATASTTVAPSGNAAAGLVLVSEAPGPDDDRAGVAFSGAPGQRLDRVLGSAGLGRESLLLVPMLPWRPPGGRPPSEAEVALCLPFLHRLLVLVRPRRLVLLGAGPLRALAGVTEPLRKVRGKWVEAVVPGLGAPVPALPMLPPELFLSSAATKQATWTDLLALRDALAG